MTLIWNEGNKTESERRLIILVQKYNLDIKRNYCLNCFFIGTEYGGCLNKLIHCYKFHDNISPNEIVEEKTCFIRNPDPQYYYDAYFYLYKKDVKLIHEIEYNDKSKILINKNKKKRYSQLNDVYKCKHFSNFDGGRCSMTGEVRDCYYRCPLDKPQCIKDDCINFDKYIHDCVECLNYFYEVYPKRQNKDNYKKSTITCEYCGSEFLNNQENCPFCYKDINKKKSE